MHYIIIRIVIIRIVIVIRIIIIVIRITRRRITIIRAYLVCSDLCTLTSSQGSRSCPPKVSNPGKARSCPGFEKCVAHGSIRDNMSDVNSQRE